jgi:hypothetical protein
MRSGVLGGHFIDNLSSISAVTGSVVHVSWQARGHIHGILREPQRKEINYMI